MNLGDGAPLDVVETTTAEREADDASEVDNSAREFIESWLSKNGVDLEMKVAGAFRKRLTEEGLAFSVDHSRTYVNANGTTDGRKLRETDVVVWINRLVTGEVWVCFWLIIECKSSKKSPWILYRDIDEMNLLSTYSFDEIWTTKSSDGIDPKYLGGYSGTGILAPAGSPFCYSSVSTNVVEGNEGSKNWAREAILQVNSAVEGVKNHAGVGPNHKTLHVLVPVVVTSAPMWTVTLLSTGDYQLDETKREFYLGRLHSGDTDPTGIWILNESELSSFVDEYVNISKNLFYRP